MTTLLFELQEMLQFQKQELKTIERDVPLNRTIGRILELEEIIECVEHRINIRGLEEKYIKNEKDIEVDFFIDNV